MLGLDPRALLWYFRICCRFGCATQGGLPMFARAVPIAASTAALLLTLPAFAQDLSTGRWIDLTHPFNAESVYWPTAEMFEKEEVFEGVTEGGWYYSAYNFSAAEHGGTHIDAPIHFAEGADTVDEVPVEQMIGPGFVIDISDRVTENVDYQVSAADIEAFEREHDRIPEGAIVLINTGRASLYPDRATYMGTAERGAEAVAKLHFPGLGKDGAELLVERGIGAVGIDTPSIDYGQSKNFETHVTLMTNNIPAFENVANLSELPATGSTIVALPMKIEGGSGGPLRIVAHLSE
ncbi:MAG TPA: cyclase family protein [Alphaproteobacteria bacterium]|nr:cyclase family protein [Alphaproteobacteria bacterium]